VARLRPRDSIYTARVDKREDDSVTNHVEIDMDNNFNVLFPVLTKSLVRN